MPLGAGGAEPLADRHAGLVIAGHGVVAVATSDGEQRLVVGFEGDVSRSLWGWFGFGLQRRVPGYTAGH